jgi:hypothetical protein
MIANVRDFNSATVDQVNQEFPRLDWLWPAVDGCRHILSMLQD